jgi:HlyD family secretion protein
VRPSRGSGGQASGRTRPVPVVAVGNARRVDLPRTLQLTASIASLAQSVVFPKVSGYLQVVTVRPGDAVRAGQVIAVVDHAQLDAQVMQAEAALVAAQAGVQTAQAQVASARAQLANAVAQLASARAGFQRAQAQLVDAKSTYDRTMALAQQGAVAQQNVDDARASLQSAQAGVDAAAAQVAQAEAQIEAAREQEAAAVSQVRTQQAQVATQAAALENTRLQLQYATITAPFSGVVVSRSLDPGAYVTPGTSTPILTIADLDHLYVIVNITEADLTAVHKGDAAQIQVDAYPGQTFRGAVSRIAGGVDPVTRTVQVETDVPNTGHPLRPGMYATVQLAAGSQPGLVLPLSALVTVSGQHYVWVVIDGKTTERPVTVGRATGDVVEITSGVSEQDLVVVRGTDLVGEGQQVRGVPADQPGAPQPADPRR